MAFYLLRANYDAYIRRRLIHETKLEREANAFLAEAGKRGAGQAMNQALEVLNRVVKESAGPELRARIEDLCAKLFHSIGLQTSVEKYHASGAERGAILDFVDYPMNNRWWLEDEFQRIRAFSSEQEKVRRLDAIATWENPGPGSFYDNVGNAARSPHVLRAEADSDPGRRGRCAGRRLLAQEPDYRHEESNHGRLRTCPSDRRGRSRDTG